MQGVVSRNVVIWLLAMSLLSPMAVAIVGVVYTQHVQQQSDKRFTTIQIQSDQRWCGLFTALDVPVPSAITDPVQRQRSMRIVKIIHQLRTDMHCFDKAKEH